MEDKTPLQRWMALLLGIALTWAAVFVAGPALIHSSDEMTRMAAFIEESGIETGEFFYTDVEACGAANLNTRNTIAYLPHGKADTPN